MLLTKEETIERLHQMADDSVAKREAFGIDGENPDFVTLTHALAYLAESR